VREGLGPAWTIFPDYYHLTRMSEERTKEELALLSGGDYPKGLQIQGGHLTRDATTYVSRWYRTVAGFIDAEILIGGASPKLIRREIPYYGQKKEVIK